MAANDEYVVGIRTEVYESEETMQSLKNRIKSLQDEILNLDKDTEKYNKTLEELQKASQKYNETISLTKKNAFALEGSYDALTQKMSLLKKEWRATNDESRRNELGKQIADINTQLKSMDAEIGNYQRNVGNYEGSLQRNNFGLNNIYFHLLEMIYKNIHKRSTGNIGYTHIICNLRYTTQTGAEAMGFKQNNLTSLAGCSNRCRYAGRTTTNNGNIVIHKSILRTKNLEPTITL